MKREWTTRKHAMSRDWHRMMFQGAQGIVLRADQRVCARAIHRARVMGHTRVTMARATKNSSGTFSGGSRENMYRSSSRGRSSMPAGLAFHALPLLSRGPLEAARGDPDVTGITLCRLRRDSAIFTSEPKRCVSFSGRPY